MNSSGISLFNQARIEWAIRLKYSPMPALDMDILSSQLNSFRIGDFRQIGKTWEVMMERDGELAVNSDKRKSDAAGLEWQIVSDGSPDGDRHAAALQYFYENLTATEALDQDVTGGADELIYQVAAALDYKYSIHEMLLRVDNAAAREVTAEFRHTPLWFFEARRGYLGYMPHIFDMYGIPCVQGEWLTAVNIGWMRPLCMAYAMKMFPLRDWLLFCTRYGSGFLDATSGAAENTPEWQQALNAMNTLANDGAVLHNSGVSFKFLEQPARNSLPFHPIVEMINGLYAKCYRGVDLATGSRGAAGGGAGGEGGQGKSPVGASVQKEESGIFLVRDAKWLTGVFNERVDRPVIRYLFSQEPRAWFVLMPPLDDTSPQDLAALQGLVPMGLKVMLKEVYHRFRWSVPEAGEACLTAGAPVAQAFQPAGSGDFPVPSFGSGELGTGSRTSACGSPEPAEPNVGLAQNVCPTPAASAAQPQAEDGGSKIEDGKNGKDPAATSGSVPSATLNPPPSSPPPAATAPSRVPENTPIAPGADPKRNPGLATPGNPYYTQAESRQMPVAMRRGADGTPEVNDGAGWSVTGLQSPALGYSIPNAQLDALGKLGLGNSRAAQALRRNLQSRKQKAEMGTALALANEEKQKP
jgi:phage gp29-like protein